MRSHWELFLTGLVGLVFALLGFLALLVGQHLYQDHQTFHLAIALINQNLQEGKLGPISAPTGEAPPPTPPAPPAPAPKK